MERIVARERPTQDKRNQAIRDMLANGKRPLLQLELDILEARLEELAVDQATLGRIMADAMSESAETWHDNAPAEAISSNSHLLASEAETLIIAVREAVLIESPKAGHSHATIGSKIGAIFGGGDIESFFLTGYARKIADLPEEVEVITISSPIGAALLGAEVGQTVSYDVNGRSISLEVHTIE